MNYSRNLILLKFFNLTLIILILYFSTVNLSNIPIDEDNLPNDKVLHLATYLILSLSTILARWDIISITNNNALTKNKVTFQNYSFVIFFCLMYGTIIEVIQGFVPSRNFDILDIITNGAGIFLGILLYFILLKLFKSYNTRL